MLSGAAAAARKRLNPGPTVLTPVEEAAIVLFRQKTLLPLDDCLYALQEAIPLEPFGSASLFVTPWHQPPAPGRGGESGKKGLVQGLPPKLAAR